MGDQELAKNDPAKYFQKVFGDVKKANIEDIQHHIDTLNPSLFPSQLKASLYKFAGDVFLNVESTKKAEILLKRSSKLLGSIKKKSSKNTQLQFQRNECKMLLAFCFIRNYERVDEAKSILSEIVEKYRNVSNVQCGDLCMQARLGLIEYFLLHEPRSVLVIADLIEMTAAHLAEGSFIEDSRSHYNLSFKALTYNFAQIANVEREAAELAGNIQFILLNGAPNSREANLHLFRTILRLRHFQYMDTLFFATFVSNFTDNDNCIAANAFHASGLKCILDGMYDFAMQNVARSWRIYKSELGEDHLLTIETKFQVGHMRVALGDRSTCLDATGMLWMSESIEAMRKIGNGLSKYLFHALLIYAAFSSQTGNFLLAETYLKESIEIQTKVWKSPNHVKVLTARHLLGCLYFQYKKWKLAIAESILVSSGLSKEPHSKFSVIAAEAKGFAGYSFLKLGNISQGERMLFEAKDTLHALKYRKTESGLLLITVLLAYFHFCFSKDTAKVQESFDCSFDLFLDIENKHGTVETEVYILIGFLLEGVEKRADLAREYYNMGLTQAKNQYILHPSICDYLLALAKLDLADNDIRSCESKLKEGFEMAVRIYGGKDENIVPFVEVFGQLSLKKSRTVDDILDNFCLHKENFFKLGCPQESEALASISFDVASAIFHFSPLEGKSTRCIDLITESYNLLSKVLGSNHYKTARSQQLMGLCYLKLGELKKAEWNLFKSAVTLSQSPKQL